MKDLSQKKNVYPLSNNLRKTKHQVLMGATPLKDCLNDAYQRGEMSISQRRGVISLFPKKNKDTLLLKNWRPITLLDIGYKIATKCIAKQPEKVLPMLSSRDQNGLRQKWLYRTKQSVVF